MSSSTMSDEQFRELLNEVGRALGADPESHRRATDAALAELERGRRTHRPEQERRRGMDRSAFAALIRPIAFAA